MRGQPCGRACRRTCCRSGCRVSRCGAAMVPARRGGRVGAVAAWPRGRPGSPRAARLAGWACWRASRIDVAVRNGLGETVCTGGSGGVVAGAIRGARRRLPRPISCLWLVVVGAAYRVQVPRAVPAASCRSICSALGLACESAVTGRPAHRRDAWYTHVGGQGCDGGEPPPVGVDQAVVGGRWWLRAVRVRTSRPAAGRPWWPQSVHCVLSWLRLSQAQPCGWPAGVWAGVWAGVGRCESL
jgi:hypothetical protein